MRSRVTRLAWATLAFNVVVILMGALVRATGSGAGCGRSWPTCQGEMLPALEGATAVEFAHRAASGVALLLVGLLAWRVFRGFPAGSQVRAAAVASVIAIVGEALIGAAIVLFEWVADDASVARAVAVPLHLVNTFFLLAALTLTAHWAGGGAPVDRSGRRRTWNWLVAGAVALLVVAGTGAVTALADTLFPLDAPGGADVEHFLTDLRVVHPILAVSVVLLAAWAVVRRGLDTREVRVVTGLVVLQVVSGVMVVTLGLVLWIRLAHLALADLLWVAYVLMGARLLAVNAPAPQPSAARSDSPSETGA